MVLKHFKCIFGIEAVFFGRDDPFKVKRILLIEDESLIRSSLARALSKDGFTREELKNIKGHSYRLKEHAFNKHLFPKQGGDPMAPPPS